MPPRVSQKEGELLEAVFANATQLAHAVLQAESQLGHLLERLDQPTRGQWAVLAKTSVAMATDFERIRGEFRQQLK